MDMRFTKMHGIGNDYVYVNGALERPEDPAQAARLVSDRHFGIGSDGLILINPSDQADFEMEMYNADGSRGKMCGNGIRCVGKYVSDHSLTQKDEITVETLAGIKRLQLHKKDGRVDLVRVDMGAPILAPSLIPVDLGKVPGGIALQERKPWGGIILEGQIPLKEAFSMKGTCVSMGNPHCVVQVADVAGFDVSGIGPLFEHNPFFPEGVNTEFIHVDDRKNVTMRVWERGSGETWACGTGACATAVACILNGLTDPMVTVHLRGGDLQIEWDMEKNTVFMTGPAVTVFEGEIDLEGLCVPAAE
jgi:diaminopimelate epimerase